VTSGPVSPPVGAVPDNNASLIAPPSSVRRGGESSVTTGGDYWMTADSMSGAPDFSKPDPAWCAHINALLDNLEDERALAEVYARADAWRRWRARLAARARRCPPKRKRR
jgi:hypothetical protein